MYSDLFLLKFTIKINRSMSTYLRKERIVTLFILSLLLYIIFYIGAKQDLIIISPRIKLLIGSIPKNVSTKPTITIVVVTCGDRIEESLTMIKSSILFNVKGALLAFIILAEQNLHFGINETLTDWQEILPKKFTFNLLHLQFPKINGTEWKSLFKPCASQRLFLPSLFENIDSVLYMDTDTIFVAPVSEVWDNFKKFNSSQMAALSPENVEINRGVYNKHTGHPFYGESGLNSGVMLMNLTRMRLFKWEQHIFSLYQKYKLKIIYGDQDLINILFFYHPDTLYALPCEYNYRSDFCDHTSLCKVPNGIQIMHGNRGYFHAGEKQIFTTVYNSLTAYEFGKNSFRDFLLNLDSKLSFFQNGTNCDNIKDVNLKCKKYIY